MDLFQAFILSIIEGITEFLPISSTGHLILTSKLLSIPESEFVKTFEIVIQLGAILSVVFLYGKKLIKDREVLKRVVWAFIPTAILGFLLYKIVKQLLLGNISITIAALFLGGIFIILFERYFATRMGKSKIAELSFRNSIVLGIVQTLSVIPGVSRSATTIFGGMFLGLSREAATELSFLVAIPVMFAATVYDFLKNINSFNDSQIGILFFGMTISFFTSLAAIKWLIKYVQTHSLSFFGVYRVVIALFFLLKGI